MHKKTFLKITMLSFIACNFIYADDSKQLDSVTVTANKVEEKLQDIPQSISVVDELMIDEKGIQETNDLLREIPNISSVFFGYYNDVNIRGINSSVFTNNNPLVIYVDGVPTSNRVGYDIAFTNIERIEVLRGPQGTLYGKNSIGGVINIITKTPENEWQGNITLEYGDQNSQYTKFDANGALIEDELFLGLNGFYSHDDGWIENTQAGMDKDANADDQHGYGLNLTYLPNDNLKIKATASNQYRRIGGYGSTVVLKPTDTVDSVKQDDYEKISFDNKSYTKTDADSLSLNINYMTDELTFDSITTHRKLKSDGDYDLDYGVGVPSLNDLIQFQHSTTKNTTQEFRLSNNTQDGIKWLAGLYYEKEIYKNDRYGGEYPIFDPTSGGFLGNFDMDDISKTDSVTKAIFAQTMIPFADDFELTLGGRYQALKRDFKSDFYRNPLGTTGAPPSVSLDAEHKWKVFLPKTSLSYKVNDNVTTYGTISKGYLPGGYNYWTSSSVEEENRFKPQSSINYEIGARMSFDDLYLSAALFYMDINDIHVYRYDRATGLIATDNVDSATSQGLELELTYLINDEWKFNSAIGLTKAEYDSSYTTAGGENNGNTIEKTPSYTFSAGLQYSNNDGLYGRFDLYGKGKTYFNPENTRKESSYVTADLKLGYLFDDLDVYTYVKNITDEEYIVGAMDQTAGTGVSFGERRRFGIGMRYSF